MKEIEIYNILRHIKLGISERLYYDYRGEALPLRPISSWEYDQCFSRSLKYATKETAEILVKTKIDLIDLKKEIDLNNELYSQFFNFYNEVDYWIVYFSMKDFQSEDFSKPDFNRQFSVDFEDYESFLPKGFYIIKRMDFVHKISAFIMNASTRPIEVLREVIKSDSGKVLATIHYNLNVPITDKAWEITPLQSKFIVLSHPDALKHYDDTDELPGFKSGMTAKEILKKVRGIRQPPWEK